MTKLLFSLNVLIFFNIGIIFCNADCGQLLANSISENDKQGIVNKHNEVRSFVAQGKLSDQPKAKNLGPLAWDAAIAAKAQEIANTCEYGHVGVNDPRFYVGQNIAQSWSSAKQLGADWPGIVQMWFDEHKNFIYPNKTKGSGDVGHYTQVVWADTHLIGCGSSWFFKNSNYYLIYVCNYAPGGNIEGRAPYAV